jgi:glucan biosynthesis protein
MGSPARSRGAWGAGVVALVLVSSFCRVQAVGQSRPADAGVDFATIRQQAAELAQRPYEPTGENIPEALQKIDYSQYVAIRYREDRMV